MRDDQAAEAEDKEETDFGLHSVGVNLARWGKNDELNNKDSKASNNGEINGENDSDNENILKIL